MTNKITIERETLESLLDALEPLSAYGRVGTKDVDQAALQLACTALRAALSAQLSDARLQFVAAFGQEQKRGWQPIETAPKDFVTVFDGWNGERVPNVSWGKPTYSPKETLDWCVEEYEQHFGWVNAAVKGLTHWMPLPAQPADAQEPSHD